MPRNARAPERLIKFVGDPRLVKEDGFGVPNWKYENNRLIANNRVTRVLYKDDGADIGPDKRPIKGTGISKEYVWDKRNLSRVIPVLFRDAQIILRVAGNEFKDVTDAADPAKVHNDVIVVKSKKRASSDVSRA